MTLIRFLFVHVSHFVRDSFRIRCHTLALEGRRLRQIRVLLSILYKYLTIEADLFPWLRQGDIYRIDEILDVEKSQQGDQDDKPDPIDGSLVFCRNAAVDHQLNQ
jgi:hypothetical protein